MTLALVLSLFLAQADTLSAVQKSYARQGQVRIREEGSAATGLFLRDAGYTVAGVLWNGRSEKTPVYRELEGRSLSEGRLEIATLVPLDSISVVRGRVNYTNGMKRDVRWNASSDYLTLYPYVVADTVGGDVHKEEYAFSGGYASRRGRLHWGIEGAYRALHEYRMVDPRPRNIVSDLTVRASGGWLPAASYALDFTLEYRRYSQSQNLSFYSEKGKNSSIFHFTGLGSHFARFSGATDSYMSTRYAGNGITLGAMLLPLSDRGWNASLSYSFLDITHYLPNLNQVPYTELFTRTLQARGQYLSRGGAMQWKAGGQASLERRTGQESILDSGASGYLKELGRFSMFSSTTFTAGADALAEWSRPSGVWTARAGADYRLRSVSMAYPSRLMETSGLELVLGAAYRCHKGYWLFSGSAEASYYHAFNGILSIPLEYTIPAFSDYYGQHFRRLCASSFGGSLCFQAERQLTRSVSLYAGARLGFLFPEGFGPALAPCFNLGIHL